MFSRLSLALLLLATGCTANRCQELCESFYQMQSRCELFGQDRGIVPLACAQGTDPQTIVQQADFSIQQCRQDFQNPSSDELHSCCKMECYQNLLEEYDAVDGTQESDYEMRRDLCQKYRQLVEDGETSWCSSLQLECLASS